MFPIRRNGKHNHKYLCKCHRVLLEAWFGRLESYCPKFSSPDPLRRFLHGTHAARHTSHSLPLSVFKVGVIFHFFYPLFRSLQREGVCSVSGRGRGEHAPSGRQPEQRPSLSFTKKEEKSEAAIFSVNSFLECSGPDARGFISMELDHKWDQARCSVICHQIARMQCPNMERMSCPKHLFLAMAFPASRSKLQLIDKHRPRTPLRPTPHFP